MCTAGFEDYFPFIPNDLMAAGMLANNPDMVSTAWTVGGSSPGGSGAVQL
jgi:hypothetical protein